MISKSQQISALARDAGETMTEAQQALARRDYEAALAGLRDAAINLAAIGVLRGQERWGVGTIEQAFRGYMAIPERTGNNWWVALGVAINATLEQAEAAYRSKAKEAHPDTSGSTEAMAALNLAIAEARKNLGATQ